MSRIRSLAFRDETGAVWRRPGDEGIVPIKAAPFDRFLKARGSEPPRLWVSGIGQRLVEAGAGDVVSAAKAHVREAVQQLLTDPKGDTDGDYFAAYLRAVHRDIYDDIDVSDPEELRGAKLVPSLSQPRSRKARHNLGDIVIPTFAEAFSLISTFNPEAGPSTAQQQVLSKIIVDAFQLRVVDLAAILRVAEVVMEAPERAPVVVVLYAGGDHADVVSDFWQKYGFHSKGLPHKGFVGKRDWDDDEPRGIELPMYLHDFGKLFPVPS